MGQEGDGVAQVVGIDLPLVHIVQRNQAFLWFVQAGGEFEQGGFAATDAAEDGDFFTGTDMDGEVVEYALAFFAVGEVDVFEGDFALRVVEGDVLAVSVALYRAVGDVVHAL